MRLLRAVAALVEQGLRLHVGGVRTRAPTAVRSHHDARQNKGSLLCPPDCIEARKTVGVGLEQESCLQLVARMCCLRRAASLLPPLQWLI